MPPCCPWCSTVYFLAGGVLHTLAAQHHLRTIPEMQPLMNSAPLPPPLPPSTASAGLHTLLCSCPDSFAPPPPPPPPPWPSPDLGTHAFFFHGQVTRFRSRLLSRSAADPRPPPPPPCPALATPTHASGHLWPSSTCSQLSVRACRTRQASARATMLPSGAPASAHRALAPIGLVPCQEPSHTSHRAPAARRPQVSNRQHGDPLQRSICERRKRKDCCLLQQPRARRHLGQLGAAGLRGGRGGGGKGGQRYVREACAPCMPYDVRCVLAQPPRCGAEEGLE